VDVRREVREVGVQPLRAVQDVLMQTSAMV
jgi:hypothetical protein